MMLCITKYLYVGSTYTFCPFAETQGQYTSIINVPLEILIGDLTLKKQYYYTNIESIVLFCRIKKLCTVYIRIFPKVTKKRTQRIQTQFNRSNPFFRSPSECLENRQAHHFVSYFYIYITHYNYLLVFLRTFGG